MGNKIDTDKDADRKVKKMAEELESNSMRPLIKGKLVYVLMIWQYH